MYANAVVFRSFSDLWMEEQRQQHRMQQPNGQQSSSPRSLSILLPPSSEATRTTQRSGAKQVTIAWEDLNRFDTRSSASTSSRSSSSISSSSVAEGGSRKAWRRRKLSGPTGFLGKILKRASSTSSSASSSSDASTAPTEISIHASAPAEPIFKSSIPLQRRSSRSSSFYAETISDHGNDDEFLRLDTDFPSHTQQDGFFDFSSAGHDLSLQRFPARRRH